MLTIKHVFMRVEAHKKLYAGFGYMFISVGFIIAFKAVSL